MLDFRADKTDRFVPPQARLWVYPLLIWSPYLWRDTVRFANPCSPGSGRRNPTLWRWSPLPGASPLPSWLHTQFIATWCLLPKTTTRRQTCVASYCQVTWCSSSGKVPRCPFVWYNYWSFYKNSDVLSRVPGGGVGSVSWKHLEKNHSNLFLGQ